MPTNEYNEIELETEDEVIDQQDRQTLLWAILRQAMDDYIKLQHPRTRRKKYLEESFEHAVDMLFDSDYRMLYVKNEDGEDMALKDLVAEILNDDRTNLKQFKSKLIDDTLAFWETKQVHTLDIPSNLIFDGHVYSIQQHNDPEPIIDFLNKIIYLNKDASDSENQEKFVIIALQVAAYHQDWSISKNALEQMGKAIFRLLRMNACFTGE